MTRQTAQPLRWCLACDAFPPESEFDTQGRHSTCGEEPHIGSPRVIFSELILDAIPHALIASPAVGAGDARRLKIAAAAWPVVKRILTELLDEVDGERGGSVDWEGDYEAGWHAALSEVRTRLVARNERDGD